jgi:hypothetical protein
MVSVLSRLARPVDGASLHLLHQSGEIALESGEIVRDGIVVGWCRWGVSHGRSCDESGHGAEKPHRRWLSGRRKSNPYEKLNSLGNLGGFS